MAERNHRKTVKHTLGLVLCLTAIATPTCNGIPDQNTSAVEAWFKNLGSEKEKLTKIHFYWHQVKFLPSKFGNSAIIDTPLRIGPEPTSKQVGRAQGLFAFADQHEVGVLHVKNFVFTDGEFKGSTLSVLGRNPSKQLYRELPIVGGTGAFRLARGIVTLKTHFINSTTGYVVVEYNVVVLHY